MRSAIVIVLASVLLAAASVEAQGSVDQVFLPGGGRLRGTVEVYEPGTRVVIALPDGTRRTLSGSEFERVEFGDSSAAATTPGAAAVTPAAPAEVAPTTSDAPTAVAPTTPDAPAEPAPIGPQEVERITAAAGAPPIAGLTPPRAFGDGRGDLAWPPAPGSVSRPEGMLHAGVQVSGVATFIQNPWSGAEFYGGIDAAGYLDVRLVREVHLRFAGVVMVNGFEDFDGNRYSTRLRLGTGAFAMTVRPLIGFVLGPGFGLRLGGEVGFEVLAQYGDVNAIGGGLVELALRLLDDENLEIVLDIGVQSRTARGTYTTSGTLETNHPLTGVSGRVTLGVGWLF